MVVSEHCASESSASSSNRGPLFTIPSTLVAEQAMCCAADARGAEIHER